MFLKSYLLLFIKENSQIGSIVVGYCFLLLSMSGASTEGEVDATCVQFGSRGEEFHPQGGRIPPDIWVILMIVL